MPASTTGAFNRHASGAELKPKQRTCEVSHESVYLCVQSGTHTAERLRDEQIVFADHTCVVLA